MVKQSKLGKDPLEWINPTKQDNPKKQSKTDTPIKQEKQSKAKENLPEGWIRTTFIVKEAGLNKLKDIAYTDRKKITAVFNEAIENYVKAYKGKVLKRPQK